MSFIIHLNDFGGDSSVFGLLYVYSVVLDRLRIRAILKTLSAPHPAAAVQICMHNLDGVVAPVMGLEIGTFFGVAQKISITYSE